ncbi:peptidase M23 family protein [Sphingomonas sp. S17]|nr:MULTISPECIES: peptidoglycan DD-metalloendopeptidase family protein [Sphingomonas]EGI54584.1 peptidase M23 family protein [Sphingomonas sp. S17]MCM3678402.1 peptidoglycan DD-metalloendopeptidase family protein [Sphingomonas paucimobilis]MDG5969429.1 peptidoglycan DD-metalloendopeptidase family protein [Sphingomonas paucimobilis]
MRRRLVGLSGLLLLGATDIAADQRRLAEARAGAATAQARARGLEQRAGAERDAAAAAEAKARAMAARVAATEAEVRAARARVALVAGLLERQRDRLAQEQAPLAHLLAAMQDMAARPPIAAVAQPGTVADLAHVRAVFSTIAPVIAERSASIRRELAATRRVQAQAAVAAQALSATSAKLESQRQTLARLEALHRGRADQLGQSAIDESNRALALGEAARDIVDRMAERGTAQATAGELVRLAGPVARPLAPGVKGPEIAAGTYRLPVRGRVAGGFGEISDAGVRARGITLATAPSATVVAPAAGTVRYAAPFRGYGGIVILDHGEGWTSLVTGLGGIAVHSGERVETGAVLGRAGGGRGGAAPRVTVELRRDGRPMDIAALLG